MATEENCSNDSIMLIFFEDVPKSTNPYSFQTFKSFKSLKPLNSFGSKNLA